jgi:hypothetical protein
MDAQNVSVADSMPATAQEVAMEPAHSPKGASSAERWMNCPGSGVLLKKLDLPETEEQDYRAEGLAMHEAAAHCLENWLDTWEIVGQTFHGVVIDKVMADSVQIYLDFCRPLMDGATVYIEKRIGGDPAKRPHPDFYGTVDFSAYGPEILDITDLKGGEGIIVEPEENPQMKYYAYGIILERIAAGVKVRSDRIVRLSIVQPRAFHYDGPIRTWETTVGEIIHWAENELIPAMERAEFDVTLDPGKWCRFCPAKLFCPMLQGLFGAAAKADASHLANFGQKRLSLEYGQLDAVNFYIKAMKDEVYRRNMLGNTVPGTKLVLKKSNRIFRDHVVFDDTPEPMPIEFYLKNQLGDAIYTKPELKTPAEIEKLGPAAKKIVQSTSYMPNNGLTVALDSDPKPGVKVEKAADAFAHLIEAADATATNGD